MEETPIKVYTLDTRLLEEPGRTEEIYALVSERRREKTDRLRRPEDRRLSLGAEYLLMCALYDSGLPWKNLQFTVGANGKPALENIPLHFNLSHGGKRAMCVLSSFPVGCDVEKSRPIDIKLAARFFAPEENAEILEADNPEEAREKFFRFWTLKESYCKCTGKGLSLPLHSFALTLRKKEPELLYPEKKSYRFFERKAGEAYYYALCVGREKTGKHITCCFREEKNLRLPGL